MCAEYIYDAWGRVISSSNLNGGTVANINPFRYKDYYFDTETGFYYLQSRYYDPTVARFISADSVDYLGASGSVLSYNLFAYCENEPIQNCDPSGKYSGGLVIAHSLKVSLSPLITSIIGSINATILSIKAAISSIAIPLLFFASIATATILLTRLVAKVNKNRIDAEKVKDAVNSKVKKGGLNKNDLRLHTVYVIIRKIDMQVVYVGRTCNFIARESAHNRGKFPRTMFTMLPIATGLTLESARALEQTLISSFTLIALENSINSISPAKINKFKLAIEQLSSLIEAQFDPE